VSVLPVTTPQVTDPKVTSQKTSGGSSDTDSTFSDLVEQHYVEDNGGKEAKNDGNGKSNPNEIDRNVNNRNNTDGISSDQKAKANNEINASNEKTDIITEEKPIVEQVVATEAKDTNPKNNQDVASQLLSFITSSDKILSTSEQKDVPIEVKEQESEGNTLASLLKGSLFSKDSTTDEQTSKVITAETVTSKKEPISENLTAEQLLIRSAMLKDSQKQQSDSAGLTEEELALQKDKVTTFEGKTVVGQKTEALPESAKKVEDSELGVKKLVNEKDESTRDGEFIAAKETGEQGITDKKVTNDSTGKIDKKDNANLTHLAAQSIDKSNGEKETTKDKTTDKNTNGVGLSVNANPEKSTVSNEGASSNARAVNQSTASFMEQNNTGEQHKSSEGSQQNTNNEELSVAIDENEQNTVGIKKQVVVANTEKTNINPTVEPVIPRAIVPESEGGRTNHNIEAIMSNMASEVSQSQSQKSTAALQNETIAIYKKDFTNAVKDKVMVMINQKIQQVEIQLDPAELGSMSIRVNLQNEQAVVSFMVQNQQAKEAVEENIDKLKNMLAESGIDVGDANIEQQDQEAADNEEQNSQNKNSSNGLNEEDVEQELEINRAKLVKASSTGVDYYA